MDNNRRKVRRLVLKLARKHGMTAQEYEDLVNSPYHFTHDKLKEIDFDRVESEDEAKSLKTNFNYMALGKLYFSYPALVTRKKRIVNASKMNKRNGRN